MLYYISNVTKEVMLIAHNSKAHKTKQNKL